MGQSQVLIVNAEYWQQVVSMVVPL